MGRESMKENALPLVESKKAKGRIAYRLFASTILLCICLIWIYRIVWFPRAGERGRLAWLGMLIADLLLGFYWICTQSVRWNVIQYSTFEQRLSQRYEGKLPGVDIFVCTADPMLEPPILVINTILSVMSYNYPTERLSVYLSDDGGSELTFYALLEASHFSKYWIPFCKTHNVEPRSPEAYFAQHFDVSDTAYAQEWSTVKKLYEEMKQRIGSAMETGSIPEKIRRQHKGFSEWDRAVTKGDHQPIVQIIIDGRDKKVMDNSGCRLPTLVYMAREKRPQYRHNFKAGAMNALIRVSSEISSGSIILNLDCDMYANDSDAIRNALCFFMDEGKGHEIAYVQHPQTFSNVTENDLYENSYLVVNKVELAGMGGYDAALYCGTGCFHRRETLCGMHFFEDNKEKEKIDPKKHTEKTINELEQNSKVLASCGYEKDTKWGEEMGLIYGCPVEDIVTGLTIQRRGWKSVFYCPNREAFLGVAPNTLDIALVQHRRWGAGMFQILISKFCPFIYGHGKLKLGVQLGYCVYLLWAPISLPTLYYVIVSPLCLLRGTPLFPQVSSLWFIPFAYVFVMTNVYSMVEGLSCGYTLRGWWNFQRMRLIRRTTAYFLAFIDTIIKQLGLSPISFAITSKVVTKDVLKRYEQEVMEFGSSNIMFIIIATLAMLNLFTLIGAITRRLIMVDTDLKTSEMLIPNALLNGLVIMLLGPVYQALFARSDEGRLPFSVMFKSTVLASLSVSYIPKDGRWVWIGLLGAELWFGFYWVLTQALRWNQIHRSTFKDRLSQRYEKDLPGVDIFVCTADPTIEPPIMVINTVLSVMAYDYPPEKLAIYLSDDAGSDLTFYALMEASKFAKEWIPYCKKFNVEPRSPAAYFESMSRTQDAAGQSKTKDFIAIKKWYQKMEDRIETTTKLGRIPKEACLKHEGFSQWDSYSSQRDHGTILRILINERKDPCSRDIDGNVLPTLVYLAREKRPQHFHNFKAGAMNALIRVSSKISNGQIILNLDCDMYSNHPLTVRDALCFFMDEEKSHDIAFVQFPQWFENVTKNELYSSSCRIGNNVEFCGTDGYGGPLYIGTGCFHRRDTLCGKEFNKDFKIEWKKNDNQRRQQSVQEFGEETKALASCTYEQNTQWGNEMGLKYGCPVEDVITGLSIQCRGWKSAYFNPERKAFLGLAPTTLSQTLVQHKRWSEGDFQILLSKYSPAWYAHGRISLGLQLGYCCYCLWASNCLATLYYSIIPSLYLLKGISLFPQVSSPWFLPFVYVIFAKYMCSLVEFLWADGTVLGWWNDQRIWLYKRTSSYLFAFIDAILKTLGFGDTAFTITAKVVDVDVSKRYEKEMMEFGAASPMFTILSTIAMLNLFCLVGVVTKVIMNESIVRLYKTMPLQLLLCAVLVLINLPLYQGLLLRKDKGSMASSVTVTSSMLALLACTTFYLLY